jgi:Cof subfamily protein (haloacid dehalogenase superfamily)
VSYQALAVDLDGTLLHSDDRVTERSLRALRAAEAAGLRIIVATARWYQLAKRVAHDIEAKEPVIACAGAQVRRLTDEHDLLDLRLPQAFADALYAILDRRRAIAWIALDDSVVVKMEGAPPKLPRECVFAPKLSGSTQGAPRMVLVQGSEATAHVIRDLGEHWKERVRFVESFSSKRKPMLTLTAAGADKGAALAVACADLGIATRDVVAFGDAEADIEMFRVAGASVAMGQASEHVKSMATTVTLTNDEDGVAVAIERLLANGNLPRR